MKPTKQLPSQQQPKSENAKALAHRFGIMPNTVRAWLRRHRYGKRKGRWIFTDDELDAVIAERGERR